ncbi:hypothetical protein B0T14DRAFT_424770 [Immersiella caudata]|uniref:Glutathione S-transferase UstS-like C-terminal domain-containing protein n=1 Tax=Immersiella caudata TaxID=314043 RepID=A0AA40C6U2_9PEZI|nr:hypothetical protein B0T14DRAFT_424770 [Immersiella caudata]
MDKAEEEIVLFDIPTRPPRKCWSYNPWRARMLLSYKGLKYRTEWLEYPEIRKRLENHVPPNPSEPLYTLPAILLPNGTYTMTNTSILHQINTLHPSPPLPYETPALALLFGHLEPFMDSFRAIYLPAVARNLLSETSAEYFRRNRSDSVGMSLEELEGTRGGERAYGEMEVHLRGVTALLGEDESGPFFGGTEVAYVDFVWVGLLVFVKKLGDGVFEEVMRRSGKEEVHGRLLDAFGKWTERED